MDRLHITEFPQYKMGRLHRHDSITNIITTGVIIK